MLGAHAREPTQWPHAGDRYRATHRALLPTRLPSYADYILRLQDTEPESLGIMLRLLLVALPLVVALPAAFDKQEVDAQQVDATQIEVQAPLQFEVRSPPKSRPLRPAATRDQHDCPATLHSARTPSAKRTHHNGRAAAHWNAGKTIHATIYFVTNLFTAQGYTHHPQVCPQPGRPPRMRRSFGRPYRCAREAGVHAAGARARGLLRDVRSRACPTP